jgi:hypothetical protein
MQIALANESNPMDADLERVLPGINQRLNAQHSLLAGFQQQVDYKMDRLTQTVAAGFEKVTNITENWKEETDRIVGCSLVEAGTNLLRQSPTTSPGGADSMDMEFSAIKESATRTPTATETNSNSNRLLPQIGQSTTSGTSSTIKPEEHSRYRMSLKYPSLASVWNEWFGLEEYADEYGGINGRNKMHGSKWRKHLECTSYPKVAQLIKGINAFALDNQQQLEEIIAEWEGIFTASKRSVNNMVKALFKNSAN